MRTKNRTPFRFAALASSLRPPEPSATLVVKATFRLRPGEPVLPLEGIGAQGWISGDRFAYDDDDRGGRLVHASDLADFKLKADVIVRARCHTPGHKPMTECPVRVSVGAWSKTLRVVGRRVWIDGVIGATPSDPVPFTEMPIDYTQAFGGPSFADNPAGKGVGTAELHTVEAPGDVVRGKGDRIAPASFAPLSPFWPQRRGKVGKEYGKRWEQTRAPYVAEDFDWSYFNAAPPDQQIDSLRGDEEIAFVNLHPAAPTFSATLPGIRIRAFLRDDRDRAREVTMRLDTLVADLEEETLTLTWRGVDTVREDDLADLQAALVLAEPFVGPPRPAELCFAELAAYAADPVGWQRKRDELLGLDKPELEPDEDDDDPLRATARERFRGVPAAHRERVLLTLDRIGQREVPGHDVRAAVTDALKQPPSAAPTFAIPRKPGVLPYVPLGAQLRSLRAIGDRVRAQVAADPRLAQSGAAQLAEIDAVEHDPFLRKLDPYAFRPEGPGKDEPGPGADLSGRDLSEQDLSGKDLSGANLEGAILRRARLAGCNLRGARMKHAILYDAVLEGADLTKADLTQANLTLAQLRGAKLREAVIAVATFDRAGLAGADLSGVKGESASFDRADLSNAVFRGAELDHAFFDSARIASADFSGAQLVACRFRDAGAEAAVFSGALLNRSTFERAQLRGALFPSARGDRVSFRFAKLEGADLRHVIFKDPFFDDANADGARLSAASLRGARFYRASLVRADLTQADLLAADLRKADLTGASFVGASLFEAQMRLVRREGADFAGANLTHVVTDGRSPPER
jgi:uncharacterized protein YjbI with pentapeptide repeats